MPFRVITKKYENQLITKVVIKENHVTLYFGDYSQNPNGSPPAYFATQLNTCLLYETNRTTFCDYHDGKTFLRTSDSNEIKQQVSAKDVVIINQHSNTTYSSYHDTSFFDCCCPPPQINHLHFKVADHMTSDRLNNIFDIADRYQNMYGSFDELLQEYKAKNENQAELLLVKSSFKRSQCRIL